MRAKVRWRRGHERRSQSFPLTAQEFSGQLVLGGSSGQTDAWSGEIFGAAIYQRGLSPTQAFENFAAWTRNGRPDITPEAALYLFDERAGSVVRNKVGLRPDLTIPTNYQVLGKIVLEPLWTEFRTSWNYWGAAIKNVLGFIPYGFCFYAYLAGRPTCKRVTLTVVLGTAASLTIEVLQAFLPTRESGTTDLVTNTLGTFMGTLVYRLSAPALARFFPAISFPENRIVT